MVRGHLCIYRDEAAICTFVVTGNRLSVRAENDLVHAVRGANRDRLATRHTPLAEGSTGSAAEQADRYQKGNYKALKAHARNICIIWEGCTWRNEAAPSDFSDRAANRYDKAGIRLVPVLFRCLF
jgi:hypothetical protein